MLLVADLLRQLQRAHHAAGGPACHQEDRLARRLARGNDAAGRIEYVERSAEAAVAQQVFDPVQIIGDFRCEIGVEHGRSRALVFADDRRDLAGQTDKGVRRHFANDGADALFVRGIAERPEQHHRESLRAGVDQFADRAAHALFVERNEHATGLIDALAHLAHQAAGHDRIGVTASAVAPEMLDRNAGSEPHQPLQRQRVAEAARGDEAGGRAGALDQCVGGLRGAVAEGGDLAEKLFGAEPLRFGRDGDRVEHAFFQFAGCGGRLGGRNIAALIHQHQIGEGAADIDSEIHNSGRRERFPSRLLPQALRDSGAEVHLSSKCRHSVRIAAMRG